MARVLITGCSTGFGRASAIELKRRGHEVVATARQSETLADLNVAERLALDVTDDASVARAMAAAGEVDVLVNNAGITVGGPVELVPLGEVRRLFETNFFGVVRMLQAVLPQMRERGSGVIVNMSSVSGRVSAPLAGFYSASKFALEAVSSSLHFEGARFGIRTVLIEAGFFRTSLSDSGALHGVDGPPYDELDAMLRLANRLRSEAAEGPGVVAIAVADAIENPNTPLPRTRGRRCRAGARRPRLHGRLHVRNHHAPDAQPGLVTMPGARPASKDVTAGFWSALHDRDGDWLAAHPADHLQPLG